MFARIEVAMRPEYADPAANGILRRIELARPDLRRKIRWGRMIDLYWLDIQCSREELIPACIEIFWDRVLQWLFTANLIPSAAGKHGSIQDLTESSPIRPGVFWALERRFRAGVTDNVGRTALEAFEIVLGRKLENAQCASGSMLLLEGPELNEDILAVIAREVFCNELIETWTILPEMELKKSDRFHHERVKRDLPKMLTRTAAVNRVEQVSLDRLSDNELEALSKKKLWALSLAEMKAIRDHFTAPSAVERRQQQGLSGITDVEMEVIAQTWSEHCKHKIFNAKIQYQDQSGEDLGIPRSIDGLFKATISGTTALLPKPWLLSVFEDNAGVVAIDDEHAVCIKVETHNTPSALDPYGGSLTGIVGVNRDILGCGLGAKPIFNTDVFCVASPDYSQELPDRLLHPRRILDGVRRGVEHGGNKSGIPTVNGALVFDERFLGKPLIYCGTGGIMPRETAGRRCEVKEILPGDHILMVGGRIGKDGIHGATFSSLALDEASPMSAVQLGDPITQKRMADFLLEARDMGLYRAITDNGAGGLSSSIGELATLSGGARIDVSRARTKYPGLKPYELVVSESQERMSLAVPENKLGMFTSLAAKRGVEVSDLGVFTNTGTFDILYDGQLVGSLDLEFLHKGVPRLEIRAEWKGVPRQEIVAVGGGNKPEAPAVHHDPSLFQREGSKLLLTLLQRPNIASKEWLIRQYDHEVQGNSVIKPLHTAFSGTANASSGPNDAGVLKPKADSWVGVAVGCGINPKLSDVDPYLMAQAAVDEAVRNVLSVGAEYGKQESLLALVDNFCWPDPVGDPAKAGALVRACYGLRDAALALGVPLISGKDSMKNDFHGRRGDQNVTISVPPTLLMTALGRVPDVRLARTADLKGIGDWIYLLGGTSLGLMGSELHSALKDGSVNAALFAPWLSRSAFKPVRPDWEQAKRIYGWLGGGTGKEQVKLKSVHDISEGGLLVALAESVMARGFGATIRIPETVEPLEFCFGEGFHSFLATVAEVDALSMESELRALKVPFERIGAVVAQDRIEVAWNPSKERTAKDETDVARSWSGGSWGIDIPRVRHAWNREGYWE